MVIYCRKAIAHAAGHAAALGLHGLALGDPCGLGRRGDQREGEGREEDGGGRGKCPTR